MCENFEKIEKLVLYLKKDSKFKVLRDSDFVGIVFAGDSYYYERTDLENDNLKIIYFMSKFGIADGIAVMDKKKEVYAFCSNPLMDDSFMEKPIIKQKFSFDELKEYIEKNV